MNSSSDDYKSTLAEFLHDLERHHAHWYHVFDPSEEDASRMTVLEKISSLSTLISVPQDVMQDVFIKCKLAKQWRQGKSYMHGDA